MAQPQVNDKQGRTTIISGTTSSSANTKSLFYFSPKQIPQHWIPIAGSVYSPTGGVGMGVIDVRSTMTAQTFTIKLFF